MASTATATESTPLIQPSDNPSTTTTPPKPARTVTFSPHATVTSINGKGNTSTRTLALPASSPPTSSSGQQQQQQQPAVLSALQGKLKPRNSSQTSPLPSPTYPTSKIGPQRTTKTAQKLKLLPNPEFDEDEESGRDVYAQFTRIKDPTARRDAARLGKADRETLPRVTAYCTANAYRLDALMKFLKGRGRTRGAAPKLFDECLYTSYRYPSEEGGGKSGRVKSPGRGQKKGRRYSDSAIGGANEHYRSRRRDLMDIDHNDDRNGDGDRDGPFQDEPDAPLNSNSSIDRSGQQSNPDLDTEVHTPEVFLFNYGTVVTWGMTLQQEQRFLKEISKFEQEKLAPEDVQTENFNFYYTTEYQARIYNDFISLSDKKNYMIKLAISHALSQSVKTSLFEDLVDATIETTKDIPARIALTGKVNLTRRQILMQVGELFILRINIHLQGSVLDSPEVMWAEPQLDPVYQAVRAYLEMDQRARLLTERLDVIADLLTVLKDQLTHTHGEYLEWIVIVLIAAEILVAAVNIMIDVYFGMD
ncbi:MAG: hypothetical protein M1816_004360 [Peltula sp. TS41687]|nr:MAG: hypothetical protein M1816_004360 [Peltula sp. TS41687]